jgi:hypothetical protein
MVNHVYSRWLWGSRLQESPFPLLTSFFFFPSFLPPMVSSFSSFLCFLFRSCFVCLILAFLVCYKFHLFYTGVQLRPPAQVKNVTPCSLVDTYQVSEEPADSIFRGQVIRFQLLTALHIKTTDFWDVTPCSLADMWQHVGGKYGHVTAVLSVHTFLFRNN